MNFVIFNPDEWRGDYAGCSGHPLVRTPNLDRLAAAGTRFENAFVQHTVCSPSRCSFMTGWYPHTLGHRTLWHLLQPDQPNLLKYLKQAGYEVAWFGKNDLLASESFPDSVDYYDDYPGFLPPDLQPAFAPDEPGYYSFLYDPTPGTIEEHVDTLKVNAGLDFLRRDHDKPFCLYLPLSTPHCPYTAPKPYHEMYSPDDVPDLRPPELPGKPSYHQLIRRTRGLDRADESVLRKLNAVYCGTITMIDELLGRVLTTLEETGLAENTTVIVFTDHGDWAGDYGLVEKWSAALDDCLLRTPLVIRTPGGKAGHVVREPVEVFDQMATVLELAGIEADHEHFARSLVAQLHGAAGDADRAVFAEGGYAADQHNRFELDGLEYPRNTRQMYYPKISSSLDHPLSVCRSAMIRTATHKLVHRPASGEHELYDLVADPRELHNLHGQADHEQTRRELERRLLDWFVRTGDVVPHRADNRGMPEHSVYWRRLTVDR
jgi:choline-sulfatase